jgi:DNA repair protein RecO (recombination protein O)
MYINTSAIVLRETAYKDSSKILTVLAKGEGKLTVSARGAMRRNSKLAAVTQLLVFSEMTLFFSRDRWTLTEARSVEQFIGLRDDLRSLSLGAYFAELTEAVADEDSPNPELLPLILNSLFALSEKIKTPDLVKPAFELRLMAISGFAPLLGRCAACGNEEPQRAALDLAGGTIRCGDCAMGEGMELGRGALSAARHIVSCDPKKLLSFKLSGEALSELASAAEGYLLAHLDRRFRTLDFYRGIRF